MSGLLVSLLIFLIIVVAIAGILLWAVQKFFPDIYEPARYIIGAVALVLILLKLAPLLSRAF